MSELKVDNAWFELDDCVDTIAKNELGVEEIPDLAKYLPDEVETADLVSKTVPPTKCVIKKGVKYVGK